VGFGRGAFDAAADRVGNCGLRGGRAGICATGGGVIGTGGFSERLSRGGADRGGENRRHLEFGTVSGWWSRDCMSEY